MNTQFWKPIYGYGCICAFSRLFNVEWIVRSFDFDVENMVSYGVWINAVSIWDSPYIELMKHAERQMKQNACDNHCLTMNFGIQNVSIEPLDLHSFEICRRNYDIRAHRRNPCNGKSNECYCEGFEVKEHVPYEKFWNCFLNWFHRCGWQLLLMIWRLLHTLNDLKFNRNFTMKYRMDYLTNP